MATLINCRSLKELQSVSLSVHLFPSLTLFGKVPIRHTTTHLLTNLIAQAVLTGLNLSLFSLSCSHQNLPCATRIRYRANRTAAEQDLLLRGDQLLPGQGAAGEDADRLPASLFDGERVHLPIDTLPSELQARTAE